MTPVESFIFTKLSRPWKWQTIFPTHSHTVGTISLRPMETSSTSFQAVSQNQHHWPPPLLGTFAQPLPWAWPSLRHLWLFRSSSCSSCPACGPAFRWWWLRGAWSAGTAPCSAPAPSHQGTWECEWSAGSCAWSWKHQREQFGVPNALHTVSTKLTNTPVG